MFDVCVASNLYSAGANDDGTPFIAEYYFVEVSNSAGRRCTHAETFPGCTVVPYDDEDGFSGVYFEDVRESAKIEAEKLAVRVEASLALGGKLNSDFWREADPVYGSIAYCARNGC